MYNKLSTAFFILALFMLVPGITLPILTLKTTVDKQKMTELAVDNLFGSGDSNSTLAQFAHSMVRHINVQGNVELLDKTRSVLGTMDDLISTGHYFVGFLIGLFAVVIPTIKILLTGLAALSGNGEQKIRLKKASAAISKWSMSDVFVMAIFVGYLAGNADNNSNDAIQTNALLGPGFYFFTGYCLLSVLSAQFLDQHLSKLKSLI